MLSRLLRKLYKLLRDVHRYLRFRDVSSISAFRGAYESFDQAVAASPSSARIGYDHPELAESYGRELDLRLESSDYPVLFHLARIARKELVILDFGGNVGVHYLRYRRYIDLSQATWIVNDLPEIAKVGRRVCADVPNVSFVSDIRDLREPRIDVLHACCSLQYMDSPERLLEQLSQKASRPTHLLLNCIPLYDGPRFVTLQNGGLVFYPQYVFNRGEFIASIEARGYSLIDSWRENLSSCYIPFHPEKTLREFEGLYFRSEA